MRRPSPAPAAPPTPPSRRAGAPGPPPRRAPGPAGTRADGSPPRGTVPGPRPVPVRTAAPPPSRRRPRAVVLAALLTLVVVLGYGGYLAWNAIAGGDGDADSPSATGYEATVSQAIFLGGSVLGLGVDTHLLNDLGPFADATDRAVFTVGVDRARLERLARTAPGPEAEVIAGTVQSMDALQEAMIQWRDAVFNVRLGSVDDAHDAIDAALERLRGDLDRWKQVSSDS